MALEPDDEPTAPGLFLSLAGRFDRDSLYRTAGATVRGDSDSLGRLLSAIPDLLVRQRRSSRVWRPYLFRFIGRDGDQVHPRFGPASRKDTRGRIPP